jgi:hypothetical protein
MKLKIISLVLITSFISGCTGTNSLSNESSQPSVSPGAVRLASDVPWIDANTPSAIKDEETFNKVLQDFEGVGCKRILGKGIYVVPRSHWHIEYYPLYLNRYPKEFYWGTNLEKLKVSIASLERSLAMSESEISGLDNAPLKKSFKKDWQVWAKFSQKIAEQVCKKTSVSEYEAQKLLRQLLFAYNGFVEFHLSVLDSSENQRVEEEEASRPNCKEYPTDNPKFSIVKCTNLP